MVRKPPLKKLFTSQKSGIIFIEDSFHERLGYLIILKRFPFYYTLTQQDLRKMTKFHLFSRNSVRLETAPTGEVRKSYPSYY